MAATGLGECGGLKSQRAEVVEQTGGGVGQGGYGERPNPERPDTRLRLRQRFSEF